MKLTVAAIILLSSIATSFAGNFTPIPKNKIAQSCSATCQNLFNLCVKLNVPPPQPPPTAGTQQTTPTPPLIVGNCQGDLTLCLLSCQANPRG